MQSPSYVLAFYYLELPSGSRITRSCGEKVCTWIPSMCPSFTSLNLDLHNPSANEGFRITQSLLHQSPHIHFGNNQMLKDDEDLQEKTKNNSFALHSNHRHSPAPQKLVSISNFERGSVSTSLSLPLPLSVCHPPGQADSSQLAKWVGESLTCGSKDPTLGNYSN